MSKIFAFIYEIVGFRLFFVLFLLVSLDSAPPRIFAPAQARTEGAPRKAVSESSGQQLWKFETGG